MLVMIWVVLAIWHGFGWFGVDCGHEEHEEEKEEEDWFRLVFGFNVEYHRPPGPGPKS